LPLKNYRLAEKKKNLLLRARIIQATRNFFINNDYLEVETPVRIPTLIPEANIDAISSEDWYLNTSPEICMKQLLAAGYPRIFQICKCFRANERGKKHIPEFTILEWYCAGMDYIEMMHQCETLIKNISNKTGFGGKIVFQGNSIDLLCHWERLTVSEAFKKYSQVSMKKAISQGRFDEIMGIDIEPQLGKNKPLFLYNYPSSKGALARLKADDISIAERFELYIGGIELCNAFSELTDPYEQKKRFEEVLKNRDSNIPEKFLESLKYLPESAGIAMGIDRLLMIFADTLNIDDVIGFPPEDL
jgi:elongation factor P--(R)-beta-lysine ligase